MTIKFLSDTKRYLRVFGCRGVLHVLRASLLGSTAECVVRMRDIERPFTLRLNTSDVATCDHVLVDKEYQFDPSKPPKVIVDAGANIGLSSIYFANRFPQARIIAIEPEMTNFALLKRNIGGYPKILATHIALWNENTELDIVDPGYGKWGFRTRSNTTGDSTKACGKVRALTVDRIMDEHGFDFIDILKMDIEGAEKEVFEDASKWITKVGVLIIELHDRFKTGCSRSFYNATNNFEIEWSQAHSIFLAHKEGVKNTALQSVVASRD